MSSVIITSNTSNKNYKEETSNILLVDEFLTGPLSSDDCSNHICCEAIKYMKTTREVKMTKDNNTLLKFDDMFTNALSCVVVMALSLFLT